MTDAPAGPTGTALPTEAHGVLLTREWRDTAQGLELVFWAATDRGPARIVVGGESAVCFVARRDRERAEPLLRALGGEPGAGRWRARALDLATLAGDPVDGLYFARQRDLAAFRPRAAAAGLGLLESDLKPPERYLMERFVRSTVSVRGVAERRGRGLAFRDPRVVPGEHRPRLRCTALDVEASDLDGELYSIAVSDADEERVFIVDPGAAGARGGGDDAAARPGEPAPGGFLLERCADERALLAAFLGWVADRDPDVLLGWNVVGFDLDLLARRARGLGVAFTLGRDGEPAAVLPARGSGQFPVARVPGRTVLDGIEQLRAAFWSFEDFSLEAVARTLLGRGKLVHEGAEQVATIRALFATDKARLAAYNLEDCRLVRAIFERTKLIPFALERAQITGLALGRVGGSVAAFDNIYLPRLHRRGRVAPDPGGPVTRTASPGGYILDSRPGLYRNVLVLDFKSLYPSIIRTFRIDPLGLADPGADPVAGFQGAAFARTGGILPEVMEELWARREQARCAADPALTQAIKIIMNACYGVLASRGCRFFDPRLASSITRRGHEIIQRSRDFIDGDGGAGYRVIYGDTDSLFVLLADGVGEAEARATGRELAASLNAWWAATVAAEHRLRSCLEVQFERHYLRFLMPTVRGSDAGTKKRYAGLVRKDDGALDLVFTGLESVRTDWTPLARRFQRELYRRIFLDQPFETYVRRTLEDLLAGRLDAELVYRKRLGHALEEYTKHVPPHVQAARRLRRPGRWVSYVVTREGPLPVELLAGGAGPGPDYEHYRERQLAPVADGILRFLDTDFRALTDPQLAMF